MKECGITDKQISALAGNSICIPVLEQLFLSLEKCGVITRTG